MNVTLPSITGTLSIERTDSGHVVRVNLPDGTSATCKYVSMPGPEVLENAAKRMMVDAVKLWLSNAARSHSAISVEEPCTPTPTTPEPTTDTCGNSFANWISSSSSMPADVP